MKWRNHEVLALQDFDVSYKLEDSDGKSEGNKLQEKVENKKAKNLWIQRFNRVRKANIMLRVEKRKVKINLLRMYRMKMTSN